METNKEYKAPESESQMVSDSTMLLNPNINVADALWALIVNQTEEVQSIIADRINRMRNNSFRPYTIQELDARIDEAEMQILLGEIIPGEEVHSKMREYINNKAV